jgi:hypothetical protein
MPFHNGVIGQPDFPNKFNRGSPSFHPTSILSRLLNIYPLEPVNPEAQDGTALKNEESAHG